jgi:hypothetical protein
MYVTTVSRIWAYSNFIGHGFEAVHGFVGKHRFEAVHGFVGRHRFEERIRI